MQYGSSTFSRHDARRAGVRTTKVMDLRGLHIGKEVLVAMVTEYIHFCFILCHHLSKWLNCSCWRTIAIVVSSGIVNPMVPVSFITHASVKALVAFPLFILPVLIGHSTLMSGMPS